MRPYCKLTLFNSLCTEDPKELAVRKLNKIWKIAGLLTSYIKPALTSTLVWQITFDDALWLAELTVQPSTCIRS